MTRIWLVIFAALLVLGAVVRSASGQAIPAFPGAEGAGAAALGGRGGSVYFVTSLADDGSPGTLRYGITTAGTTGRTILFRTGGTIELTSDLKLSDPRITIAGQSAPGGGITIANRQTSVYDNDIVIRNVRFRPGNSVTLSPPSAGSTGEPDALHIEYVKNVMISHVSTSWSVDELMSVTNSTNVSVQWSGITEALNVAGHSSGAHSYGSLINGDLISYHHNFYADNNSRNPRPQIALSGTYNGGTVVIDGSTLNFDFRNNVIYNWGDRNGYNSGEAGLMNMNYVGNYSVAGPSTPSDKTTQAFSVNQTPTRIYLADNKIDSDKDLVRDGTNTGWEMIVISTTAATLTQMDAPVGNTTFVSTQTADAAYQSVMAHAGATWWNRDAVDARVFAQPSTQTGIFLSPGTSGSASFYPQAFGGYPTLSAGTAPTDSDNDGMPDDWEVSLGLNPNVANNNADFDNDGYTDLEEYLNDLGAWPAPLQAVFASGSSGRFALWSNWDTKWQPSRFDTAQINSGTAIVDAVGQDAGTIQVGTGAIGGSAPTLSITSGGLRVTNELAIGAGAVNQTAGLVTTGTVTFGSGTASGPSTYTLAGGALAAATIQAASGTAARTLAWSSGTIQNLDAATDLTISGSGGLTLALSGSETKTFNVDAGRTLTVGASITGSGGRFTKTGAGLLVLTGSGAGFSGGFLFGGGQLSLGGVAPLGTGTAEIATSGTFLVQGSAATLAGPVALAPGAALTVAGGGNTTFGGRIVNGGTSASGSLVLASTGSTTLSADNGYTGTTTIAGSGGIVVLGDNLAFGPSGAVALTATSGTVNATIRASRDLTAVPNEITLGDRAGTTTFGGTNGMVFTGGMRLSGGSRTLGNAIIGKTLEFSGTTVLGTLGSGSPRTLTISGSGNTLFSGPIVNGGTSGNCNLTITSSGTTKLTGINTYTGTTGVSAGTLVVNGRLGSGTVSIGASAKLMGSGTILGAVAMNGTLSPGNSPGLLTVASLILGGSSSTLMELNGTAKGTTYDSIAITQPSGLTYGGLLTLAFGTTFANGTTLDLFTLSSGTAGGDLASLVATGAYGSLTFTRQIDTWLAQSGSQQLSFSETTGQLQVFQVVPEPATAVLLVGGCVATWAGRLRRGHRTKRRGLCQKPNCDETRVFGPS